MMFDINKVRAMRLVAAWLAVLSVLSLKNSEVGFRSTHQSIIRTRVPSAGTFQCLLIPVKPTSRRNFKETS